MNHVRAVRAFINSTRAFASFDIARPAAEHHLTALETLIADAHRLLTVGCGTKDEWNAVVKRLAENGGDKP